MYSPRSLSMFDGKTLTRHGYSVDAIFVKACGTRPEWDLQDLAAEDGAVKSLQDDSRGQQGIDVSLRTATPEAGPLEADEMVTRLLEERVQAAADAGLAEPLVVQLRKILVENRDLFRVSFGQDPPIRDPPLIRRLGGQAPLTAFSGLPPPTPLTVAFSDDHVVEMSAEVLQRIQEHHLTQMAKVLEVMHRDVAETSDRRRMQARARRASKSKPPNFSVDDSVPVAMVTQHADKLTINWQGPKRIVRAISGWVFEVEEPELGTSNDDWPCVPTPFLC
ncbi:unnamed protein product [Phytophthora fragariaefolia]|uniref:Unnamed protein product n=1 Tax=Phytophthora fragariaefolia TaxID=1490495 RepID=A0A9W6XQK9_9STRA|nr:unnamed protein product [Phytophthora fragariaefolia]